MRAALMQPGLADQPREQVDQLLARDPQKPTIGCDAHQRLRDQQRDDLRVGQPSPGVLGPIGQEIVGGAEHRREQQVEVGEHRGPLRADGENCSTADFDCCRYVPCPTALAVESLI
jgi:hypothetical protein